MIIFYVGTIECQIFPLLRQRTKGKLKHAWIDTFVLHCITSNYLGFIMIED